MGYNHDCMGALALEFRGFLKNHLFVLFELESFWKKAIDKARCGEWSLNCWQANDTDLDFSKLRVDVRVSVLYLKLVYFWLLLFWEWQLLFWSIDKIRIEYILLYFIKIEIQEIRPKVKLMITHCASVVFHMIEVVRNDFAGWDDFGSLKSTLELISCVQIEHISFILLFKNLNHSSHVDQTTISVLFSSISSWKHNGVGSAMNVVSTNKNYIEFWQNVINP